MFTTKYHKNQKPMRKVKKYEDGGYVESDDTDFDTVRSKDGSATLIRKGTDPGDYYGMASGGRLGKIRAESFLADMDKKYPGGSGGAKYEKTKVKKSQKDD